MNSLQVPVLPRTFALFLPRHWWIIKRGQNRAVFLLKCATKSPIARNVSSGLGSHSTAYSFCCQNSCVPPTCGRPTSRKTHVSRWDTGARSLSSGFKESKPPIEEDEDDMPSPSDIGADKDFSRKLQNIKQKISFLKTRAAMLQSGSTNLPKELQGELHSVLTFLNKAQLVVDVGEALSGGVIPASKMYDPSPDTRLQLETFRRSLARALSISLVVDFAHKFLGKTLDRKFVLGVFVQEMQKTYYPIRQLSSNARDPETLKLLEKCVSAEVMAVLMTNLEGMSSATRAKGVEVHHAQAEVVGVHFSSIPGEVKSGMFSYSTTWIPFARRVDKDSSSNTDWLQIHLRFTALERDTILSEGKVVQRTPAIVRKSTWVYEGQLIGGVPCMYHESGSWRLIAITE